MKKILSLISKFDIFISGIAMVTLVVLTLAGVFMRKVVGSPFAWLEEVQLLLFVWSIFFAGSVAFRTGNHVGIDIIYERLNPAGKKLLDSIIFVVTILILLYLLKGSIDLTLSVTRKVTPYLRIPYWVIDLPVPIGCGLMIIQCIANFMARFKNREEEAQA